MEQLQLAGESREKGNLKKMRSEGFVPAIVYGKKREPKAIRVALKDLQKAVKTETGFNTIFDLTVDGKKEGLVRIREYQSHPINRVFTHVDFQAVDLTTKIEVEVPIHVIGKAEGVKLGGILEQQRRSLLLRCLATQIPEFIEIDISPLNIGQSVHADEIALPPGVEFPHETNFVVVAVVPPSKEEEAPAAAEAAPVEGAPAATPEGEAREGEKAEKKEPAKEGAKEEKKKG